MVQIERFMVGSIECRIVPDGVAIYEPDGFAVGVRRIRSGRRSRPGRMTAACSHSIGQLPMSARWVAR
jgi:hypothetical protein